MTEEILQIDWGQDKLNRAQNQLKENPYDLETWTMLIREAQLRWVNDVKPFFEKLVATFPSSGRYWKIYIEQEMKARNFENVEKGTRWLVFTAKDLAKSKFQVNLSDELPPSDIAD